MSRKLLFIIFIILSAPCFAQQSDTLFRPLKDTSVFTTRLNEYKRSVKSLECDFIQYKSMSVFTDEQMSEGKFYFRDENMIRWEYLSPFKYLIVISNDKLTVKDESKTNTYDLSTGNIFSAIGDNLGGILQGKFSAGNDFKVKYYENAMSFKAELFPADEAMKGFFNRIIIFYDKRQFGVSGVILNEPDGDFTRIIFKNSKPNAVVDPELFIIK